MTELLIPLPPKGCINFMKLSRVKFVSLVLLLEVFGRGTLEMRIYHSE
jgi:hypothetical protein